MGQLGADTAVVNGQRFSVPTRMQWFPTGYGPQTTGVPQVSPQIPPALGGVALGSASMMEGIGGYGTAGNNAVAAAVAHNNPWNPKVSPVWWAIVGLLLSIFLLRHVHWRETVLEGAEARGEFGPVSGGAEERVE